jgi:hypothetical protein
MRTYFLYTSFILEMLYYSSVKHPSQIGIRIITSLLTKLIAVLLSLLCGQPFQHQKGQPYWKTKTEIKVATEYRGRASRSMVNRGSRKLKFPHWQA